MQSAPFRACPTCMRVSFNLSRFSVFQTVPDRLEGVTTHRSLKMDPVGDLLWKVTFSLIGLGALLALRSAILA